MCILAPSATSMALRSSSSSSSATGPLLLLLLLLLLLHPSNGLCSRTTWVSRYQKGKNSLDFNKARDDGGFWDGSGISWTTCKQSAPRSRQITTLTPHHSIFTGRMLFLTPSQQRHSTEGKGGRTSRQEWCDGQIDGQSNSSDSL